ncbi:MAG: TlpA family protein disulfide reductase [Bacteroidota bacterium]
MLKNILTIFLTLHFISTGAQDIKRIDTEELEKILQNENDNLNVVNFWATWCSPCVTELPYFQDASNKFSEKEVSFLLISLDFPSQVDTRLKPFLKEQNINLPVVLMEDLDYNKWISKVDPTWKGSLPATLIFNNPKNIRVFISGALEKNELMEFIEENLN